MLGIAIAAIVLQGPEVTFKRIDLMRNPEKKITSRVQVQMDSLDPVRLSPKQFGTPPKPWMFPWLTTAFVDAGDSQGRLALRFRIYSQERKGTDDDAELAARMLTALWQENRTRLGIDHSPRYRMGLVDVFMCWGGKAGGEQLFGIANELTNAGYQSFPVNTIYFYDLKSFEDKLEKAREVAHEYGHATLPAIGGYSEPENWANGYLGEKLFMRWMRDLLKNDYFGPVDAMGATLPQLEEWVKQNVDPLVIKGSQALPTRQYLAKHTDDGMERYLSLALYIETVLPDKVFSRSTRLTGSTDAADYPEAIALAAEEPDELPVTIPTYLRGKALWVPLNKGELTGAKVLRTLGKWARIQPTAAEVVIRNR